jgi:sulfotransferase famil protein
VVKRLKYLLSNFFPKNNDDNRKYIIVHNHIFKNAGSTIDWALKKNFGNDFMDHRDDESMRKGGMPYLKQYLLDNSHIKALSSHHLTLPLPYIENIALLHLMMLRHPIERVTSVYNYERKQSGSALTPGSIHAKKLGLKEYIIWRMKPEVGETIRNFHTVRSVPSKKLRKLYNITDDAQFAIEGVRTTPLLGLVEKFDESMVMFENELSQYFPSIDLSYKMQNINQDKQTTQQERILKLQEEIGNEVYQLLLEKNEKDLMLYNFAMNEIENRQASISDFSNKLNNFRERCRRH